MINVVGSTPPPVAPLPPDLPGTPPTDPTRATQPSNPPAGKTPSTPPTFKKKNKLPKNFLLAGLLLFLLVIGSGVGLYLMKLNQDLRQRASVTYDDACNQNSAARCQGQDPGFICDNNPPGSGVCVEIGSGACECRRSDGGGATPTPTPTTRAATPTPTPTDVVCAQVITYAKGGFTGECTEFPTPCDVPDGWEIVESCEEVSCKVTLTPQGESLNGGESQTYTAVVTPENGTVDKVSFTSSDTDVATLSPASDESDSYQTSVKGVGAGNSTILAEVTMGTVRCSAEAELTVNPAEGPTATPTPTPTTQADDNEDDNDDDSDQLADSGGQQTGGTTKGGQPTLPSELPQTGPEDWLKYLQIGLGVLGAGALLLLFL